MKKNNLDDFLDNQERRNLNKTISENPRETNPRLRPILLNKSQNQSSSVPRVSRIERSNSTTRQSQTEPEASEPLQVEEVSLDTREIDENLLLLRNRSGIANTDTAAAEDVPEKMGSVDVRFEPDSPLPSNAQPQSNSRPESSALLKENEKIQKELNEKTKEHHSTIQQLENMSNKNAKLVDKEYKLKETISELKKSLEEEQKVRMKTEQENKALRDRVVKLELEKGELETLASSKKDDWKEIRGSMQDLQANHTKDIKTFQDKVKLMDSEANTFIRNSNSLNEILCKKQIDYGDKLLSVENFTKKTVGSVNDSLTQINDVLNCETLKKQLNSVRSLTADSKKFLDLNEAAMRRHNDLSIRNDKLAEQISEKRTIREEMYRVATEASIAVTVIQTMFGVFLAFFINYALNSTVYKY